jgi:hypothetical protein
MDRVRLQQLDRIGDGENISTRIECAMHNTSATALIVVANRFNQEIEFVF